MISLRTTNVKRTAFSQSADWEVSIRMIAFVAVAFAGMILSAGGTALLAAVSSAAGGAPSAILARLMMSVFQFALTAWVTACMTKLFLDLAARRPAA